MTAHERKRELVYEMLCKRHEELDKLFDSRMFDGIVYGAVMISLENLRYPRRDVEEILKELRLTFGSYPARDCREAFEKPLDSL